MDTLSTGPVTPLALLRLHVRLARAVVADEDLDARFDRVMQAAEERREQGQLP